jgi:hypothetical protein
MPKTRAKAQLLNAKKDVLHYWWSSWLENHDQGAKRRFHEIPSIYWHPAEAMPRVLFSYVHDALLCHTAARYLGAIAVSGALAEILLNRDSRLSGVEEMKRIGGWATLNNPNLLIAGMHGLPVSRLLDSGESPAAHAPVRFVHLRNKVAHGDVIGGGFPEGLSEYGPEYEEAARGQVTKATEFLADWFNTSPEIQGVEYEIEGE